MVCWAERGRPCPWWGLLASSHHLPPTSTMQRVPRSEQSTLRSPLAPPWPGDDAYVGGWRAMQPLRAHTQVAAAAAPSAGLGNGQAANRRAPCKRAARPPPGLPCSPPIHHPRSVPHSLPCSCCWRRGPASKPILCNACGSRYLVKRSLEGYQPLQTRRENTSKAAAAADKDSSGGEGSGRAAARRAPAPAAGRTAKPKRAAQKR